MTVNQPTYADELDTGTFPDGLIGFDEQHVTHRIQAKRRESSYERDYGERRQVNRSAVGFV